MYLCYLSEIYLWDLWQVMKTNNYEADPLLRSCGISISTQFTQVEGRVLPAPRVLTFVNKSSSFLYGFLVIFLVFHNVNCCALSRCMVINFSIIVVFGS